jgi:exoribonuclease-2
VKQVLFEEDGAFRVGTILAEAGASFQVEAAHGKRSKVKSSAVLLRFDGQALSGFMPEAQKLADPIDPGFLWEVCGADEFAFDALARDYFGRAPTPQEAAAVALALHAHPMYFYRRGRGRYQAAPEQNLKAALAGQEKKRQQQERIDSWADELTAGRLPPEIGARVDTLLFKPDKTTLEWRALDQAAHARGTTPQRMLAHAGALAGPEDYFLRRFAFEFFPAGTGFPEVPPLSAPASLPDGPDAAFSIDDAETTEIDDAFSVERLAGGDVRIGVHIAAPTVFFARGTPLEAIARERMSTVYFPGGKITMLPEGAIAGATLAAGRRVPALSLYLVLDPATLAIRATESRVETVGIAANLHLGELEQRVNADAVAAGRIEGAHGEDLFLLWRLARKLRGERGASDDKADRLDYTFRVQDGRVAIEPRPRGSPVDMLVAEMMIHTNATWGKLLAERGYGAIYRNQRGAKTRMEVQPGTHEWLGVSHYAWTTSPLRRYADLANQRQLAAAIAGAEPAYDNAELEAAAHDFETAYDAYNEHQRFLERYWCLRYLQQEGIESARATVIRDELVRIESLPLVCRTLGLPAGTAPGEHVQVVFGAPDLWEAVVPCRYAGK